MGIFKKTPKQTVISTGKKVINLREQLNDTDYRNTAKRKQIVHNLAIAEFYYAVAQQDWANETHERVAAARRASSANRSNKNSKTSNITATVNAEVNNYRRYYALTGPLLGTPSLKQPSATKRNPSGNKRLATKPKSKKR